MDCFTLTLAIPSSNSINDFVILQRASLIQRNVNGHLCDTTVEMHYSGICPFYMHIHHGDSSNGQLLNP